MFSARKHIFILTIVFFLCFSCVSAGNASVKSQAMEQIDTAAKTAELGTAPAPQQIISGVIAVVLGLIGIIFTCLMAYGGYEWITSHGVEDRVEKGKKIMQMATVGLVIVMLAYAITLFFGERIGPLVTEGGEAPQ